jgi:hypothetical protein
VTPPSVRLLTRTAPRASKLVVALTDAGSGVDPQSLLVRIDGRPVDVTLAGNRALIRLNAVTRGTHRLVVQAADYQELKNMENVPQILPNTRTYTATFRVR